MELIDIGLIVAVVVALLSSMVYVAIWFPRNAEGIGMSKVTAEILSWTAFLAPPVALTAYLFKWPRASGRTLLSGVFYGATVMVMFVLVAAVYDEYLVL